jgi:histidinol phosphatase-like enzyme
MEAITKLKESNIRIFAFTNQHHISKGDVSLDDFEMEFASYGFNKAYICPHDPKDNCYCCKHSSYMLLQASKEFNLDLTKCAVIWILNYPNI